MTLLEALARVGPPDRGNPLPGKPGDSSGDRDEAALIVWEALQRIRLRFTDGVHEDARADVFNRLYTRPYIIHATSDFQVRAYLRRALYRRCVDLVRRQNAPPQPPPQLPPSEVEPSPDPDLLLRIVNDAVALWSTERFALARERLLSTALFRQTVIDLVEIAAGRRSVPEVLGADVAGLVSTQIWDAFKRRCQRTVRALVLLVPAVAVARGWADPSLAHVPLRTLKDFAVVVEDENTAPALRELVRALVAVATCYQRALARSQTQES